MGKNTFLGFTLSHPVNMVTTSAKGESSRVRKVIIGQEINRRLGMDSPSRTVTGNLIEIKLVQTCAFLSYNIFFCFSSVFFIVLFNKLINLQYGNMSILLYHIC